MLPRLVPCKNNCWHTAQRSFNREKHSGPVLATTSFPTMRRNVFSTKQRKKKSVLEEERQSEALSPAPVYQSSESLEVAFSMPPNTPEPSKIPVPAHANQVHVTPDGKYFAVACEERSAVLVYDWSTASLRTTNHIHKSSVRSVTLSDDGTTAASGDFDGVVAIWSARTHQVGARLEEHNNPVSTLTLTPAGDTLISGAHDGAICAWDAFRGTKRRQLRKHSDIVSACRLDYSGRRALTSSYDGLLCEWDMRVPEPVTTFWPHNHAPVFDCAVDHQWRTYLTAGWDRTATLFDVRMHGRLYSVTIPEGEVTSCSVSGNGSRCALTGVRGALYVWNTANKETIVRLEEHDKATKVKSASLSLRGDKLISGGLENAVMLWKLDNVPIAEAMVHLPGDENEQLFVTSMAAALYVSFLNDGTPVDPVLLKNALISDDNRTALTSLADVLAVHILVKTVLSSSRRFDDLFRGDVIARNNFLYYRLYHQLVSVVHNERDREFAEKLLDDARVLGVLEPADVRSILGDMKVVRKVGEALGAMRTVFQEVMGQLDARVNVTEQRIAGLSQDIGHVRKGLVDVINEKEREARVRRWGLIVKLGASLIPLAGSIATGLVDASTELFLSFDAESLVGVLTESFSYSTQAAVEIAPEVLGISGTNELDEKHVQDTYKVRLAQIMTSKEFLESGNSDCELIREVVDNVYDGDTTELSKRISEFVEELQMLQNRLASQQDPLPSVIDANIENDVTAL